MANIKFSAFTQKVAPADVDFLVGYTGTDNVRIAPSTIGQGVYLPLAGGTMTGNTIHGDNVKSLYGTGSDLEIYHDGSNSYLTNATGHLNIITTSDDKDIIFKTDDGSGGVTEYFSVQGANEVVFFSKDLKLADNVKANFGNAGDLRIYHDGSNSYIEQASAATGDLIIQQKVDDKDIIFKSDDGSGGTTAYLTLDGSVGYTTVQKDIRFEDNVQLELGTDRELTIYSDGSNGLISNQIGDLSITNAADDKDIIFNCDNGSGGTTAYLTLDGGDVSTKIETIKVLMPNLPTSNPSVAGQLWNDSGTLKISAG